MQKSNRPPHILFVFGDQWRAQAFGYAGDPNAQTPCIDAFARESVSFDNAVSGCPVCSPYRASLLSGRYPLSHGMVVNDQQLRHVPGGSLADHLNAAGYDTGWIGKWHIHGGGRARFVPPEDRLGFRFWRGHECTHSYNNSPYYADSDQPLHWPGYDADAQTDLACEQIAARAGQDHPFALFLSWGPPHNPYQTAPETFRRRFDPDRIQLRPNVTAASADEARTDLAGYYAHGAALDACFGRLLAALDKAGIADNTLVVFTSDHGDMIGCQGFRRKQWPYDESIRVPFLLRWPAALSRVPRSLALPLDAPDIMPTLLGLAGLPIPPQVEGRNVAPILTGHEPDEPDYAAALSSYFPFHELRRNTDAVEYRGLRTARHTYVEHPDGPWLLFDNQADPYQQHNLVETPEAAPLRARFHERLQATLTRLRDPFEPGDTLLSRLHVRMNDQGDVFYE